MHNVYCFCFIMAAEQTAVVVLLMPPSVCYGFRIRVFESIAPADLSEALLCIKYEIIEN